MKSEKTSARDIFFMKRALELATKGLGKTSPNPMVGAVMVKNGKIIGEGYHHQAGKEHAEVLALKNLTPHQLKEATLYVTLEPCVHTNKRTPPCTDALLKSGIKSIVIACRDPNPAVKGKGIRLLRKAGMTTHVGLLKEEAEKLNEVFFKTITTPLPFVILKTATSLDGKIATATGDSKWITNELSRKNVHKLRSSYDAILTSSTTIIQDNPHLGVRMVKGRDPLRIIIDRKLKTSPKALVYRDKNVLVVTTNKASHIKKLAFQKAGIRLKIFPFNISFRAILSSLKKEEGIMSIMIEAGGTLAAAFIREKLIDKYRMYFAPIIIGQEGKNMIGKLRINHTTRPSKSIHQILSALRLKKISYQFFGDNVMVEGYAK